MDYKEHAKELLREWALCSNAKPKTDVISIQIEKNVLSMWAVNLIHNMNWGSELELAEACYQFDSRLKRLKEKIVIEVLTNGAI
jgi:hypothetical protein